MRFTILKKYNIKSIDAYYEDYLMVKALKEKKCDYLQKYEEIYDCVIYMYLEIY